MRLILIFIAGVIAILACYLLFLAFAFLIHKVVKSSSDFEIRDRDVEEDLFQ